MASPAILVYDNPQRSSSFPSLTDLENCHLQTINKVLEKRLTHSGGLDCGDLSFPTRSILPHVVDFPRQSPKYPGPELFLQYLSSKQNSLQNALEESITPSSNSQALTLIKAMRYALLGPGKRVRPILALAACEMFGGSEEAVLPTCVAIEMIHTMSLVHDDLPVMDNDDLRRGRPTTHKVYGESVAVLAGDALLAEAFGIIARKSSTANPMKVLEVIARISKAASFDGLAGGQVRDLECEHLLKSQVGIGDLEWIHIHKTAVLLNAAITCGAILGGALPEDVARLELFANYIGLAYQVTDDILDVTGDTETLGKTAGKDLISEKATYPSLIGLAESRKLANRLISEAKECLKVYGDRAAVLLSIADFILCRQS